MAIRVAGETSSGTRPHSPNGQWFEGQRPARSEGPSDSFQWVMSPCIVVGQWMGFLIFPSYPNARFTWVSLRVLYFFMTVVSLCANFVLLLIKSHSSELGSGPALAEFLNTTSGYVVNALLNLTQLILFMRFSRKWHNVRLSFERVEQSMAENHFLHTGTGSYVRKVTLVTMASTVIVAIVDLIPYIRRVVYLPETTSSDFLRELFYTLYRQMSIIQVYSPALFLWVFWIHIQAKFAVMFNDMFLAALSSMNAAQLHSLAGRLRESIFEDMVDEDWLCIRETYNEVVALTRILDEVLGPQVIVAYIMCLWEVCACLLIVLDSDATCEWKTVLCLYTLVYMFRISYATLSMASLHDEHLSVKAMLQLVPTSCYGKEVSRFTTQVSHDIVGITGMKYFTVTRSVLLTFYHVGLWIRSGASHVPLRVLFGHASWVHSKTVALSYGLEFKSGSRELDPH